MIADIEELKTLRWLKQVRQVYLSYSHFGFYYCINGVLPWVTDDDIVTVSDGLYLHFATTKKVWPMETHFRLKTNIREYCKHLVNFIKMVNPQTEFSVIQDTSGAISADLDYIMGVTAKEPEVPKIVFLDPKAFHPRKGILTRYGSKLLRDGAKYYSRIEAKTV